MTFASNKENWLETLTNNYLNILGYKYTTQKNIAKDSPFDLFMSFTPLPGSYDISRMLNVYGHHFFHCQLKRILKLFPFPRLRITSGMIQF